MHKRKYDTKPKIDDKFEKAHKELELAVEKLHEELFLRNKNKNIPQQESSNSNKLRKVLSEKNGDIICRHNNTAIAYSKNNKKILFIENNICSIIVDCNHIDSKINKDIFNMFAVASFVFCEENKYSFKDYIEEGFAQDMLTLAITNDLDLLANSINSITAAQESLKHDTSSKQYIK